MNLTLILVRLTLNFLMNTPNASTFASLKAVNLDRNYNYSTNVGVW